MLVFTVATKRIFYVTNSYVKILIGLYQALAASALQLVKLVTFHRDVLNRRIDMKIFENETTIKLPCAGSLLLNSAWYNIFPQFFSLQITSITVNRLAQLFFVLWMRFILCNVWSLLRHRKSITFFDSCFQEHSTKDVRSRPKLFKI